ncbi:MAG: FkbM family methyltransferase [Rhodospirillaceae bacterium]|jgi:FkbM family methyltransferase|nr:FkbM family methyltransferase [Rhodospirillaceae bacterium]MBT7450893.1 FkbM family methyltransferase [Rhodospirillaceae bacterium]
MSKNLETLDHANNATLQRLRESYEPGLEQTHPFHGYFEVSLFDCPTFLMFTNNDCPRAWDILYRKSFEPHSMKIWCQLAKDATGILDIGAHVGVYSLSAAALRSDITIHAFEPNPYAYSRLRLHTAVNGFENISENTFGVSGNNKISDFSWVKKSGQPISSGGQIGKIGQVDDQRIERAIVPLHMLDGTGLAAGLGAKPLVKIDVEGSEANTFRGMREIIELKPDIILESFDQDACDTINDILSPLGYSFYLVREKQGALEQRDRLMPCRTDEEDFNQFITTRAHNELKDLALT